MPVYQAAKQSEESAVDASAAVGCKGKLKLFLKHTHLEHHAGPPLVRTQPKVRIVLPNHQWESRWKDNGAENLDWEDSVMEYEVRDLEANAHIEVINH